MDCIMKTVQAGGITGLYRGAAVTVAGAFVYRGGQLGLFAQVQDMNPYKADKGPLGVVAAFVAATVARTITTPFNYPFDTVRRRMMLDSEKPAEERLYSSGVNCFFKVMQTEGSEACTRAWSPSLSVASEGPWSSRPTTASSYGWACEKAEGFAALYNFLRSGSIR